MRTRCIAFSLLVAPLLAYSSTSKDAPSWVEEVGTRKVPTYPGRVPAAVLFEEQHVTVEPSGLMTISTRKAVKILTHEGQHEAMAAEYYFAGGRKVKQLHAWLVAPNGFVKTFDKNSVTDVGAFSEMELYNEIRLKAISATNPEVGAVFAYESEVEERAQFAQDEYLFQQKLPAIESRYVLSLPSGWTARGTVFNHPPIEPTIEGSTYTWQLRDLPFLEHEREGPSTRGIVPRLAVDIEPDSRAQGLSSNCFHSWRDVSRWHGTLSAGQDEVTPELSAKVRELTSGATTEYQKIQAIGHYVQKLKYVAIEMDEAHGGGYKPHTAESVLRKQYGDCKDKANLMVTMLKAAGIQSHLVAIFAGDRTFVREEWPSPSQFNHMIVAVRVADATATQTVVEAPGVGRLLIFDPTSETTPLGDLPWYEQGSFALICAGDRGGILKMPVTKPESNAMDLKINAELADTGDLKVSFSNEEKGQPADTARANRLYNDDAQFRRKVEEVLARTAKGLTIARLDAKDDFVNNTFLFNVDFGSRSYAQLMQSRLLVFTPSVVDWITDEFPVNRQRSEPIVLRSKAYHKHVEVKLPAGFTMDEMPQASKLSTDFGQFSIQYRQDAGTLYMDEDFKVEAVTLSAAQYPQVKKFFDSFTGADRQQAVLVKN